MKKRIAKKKKKQAETKKALRQYEEMQAMNEVFIKAVEDGETIDAPPSHGLTMGDEINIPIKCLLDGKPAHGLSAESVYYVTEFTETSFSFSSDID